MCRETDGMNSEQHEELRDIHRRIDSLKEEGERQYKDVTDKLHGLEVAIAKGSRFPAGAWVAAAAILLGMVGHGTVLYAKLEAADEHATRALELIETHLAAAPIHRQMVNDMAPVIDQWKRTIPLVEERLKNLESRIVGVGPNGWHKQDHENYAKAVEAEIHRLDEKINYVVERINGRASPSRK